IPAGVSWLTHLKIFTASLLAVCTCPKIIPRNYQPDLTICYLKRMKLVTPWKDRLIKKDKG
uniref:Uncharacterized protein n=1 Tax=Prolemur simus TaxID=1328070 RepID=A0A8C9ACD6_PROSS